MLTPCTLPRESPAARASPAPRRGRRRRDDQLAAGQGASAGSKQVRAAASPRAARAPVRDPALGGRVLDDHRARAHGDEGASARRWRARLEEHRGRGRDEARLCVHTSCSRSQLFSSKSSECGWNCFAHRCLLGSYPVAHRVLRLRRRDPLARGAPSAPRAVGAPSAPAATGSSAEEVLRRKRSSPTGWSAGVENPMKHPSLGQLRPIVPTDSPCSAIHHGTEPERGPPPRASSSRDLKSDARALPHPRQRRRRRRSPRRRRGRGRPPRAAADGQARRARRRQAQR